MHKTQTARRIGLISAALLGASAAMVGSASPASAANGTELEVEFDYRGPVGDELCVSNVDGAAEQCAKLETNAAGEKATVISRKTTENQQKVVIKGTNMTATAGLTSPNATTIACTTADQQTLNCAPVGNT
jgi:hypothetical protein